MSATNNPNGAPVKLEDPKRQERFLKLIRGGASLAKACELVGLSDVRLVHDHCERDPAFADKFTDAAYEGYAFHLGNFANCAAGKGGMVRLLASKHWLACKDPDGFAAKQKHEVTGKDGGAIVTESRADLSKLTTDELQHLIELRKKIDTTDADDAADGR